MSIRSLELGRVFFAFGCLAVLLINMAQAEQPNVLLICVDDLRPELGCFGKEYIHSPNIDGLAKSGRLFTKHFVQAPTCGASRYALLTGMYGPANNNALFVRAKQVTSGESKASVSMPGWFRQHGYTTVSVGKVSHHPGGLGGADWNDQATVEMPEAWDQSLLEAGEWQHPRGWMHGLANGEIRKRSKDMMPYQAVSGPDSNYPDGINTETALKVLNELADDEKPFFFAFGILRPHLPFGAPKKYLEPYVGVDLPEIPHPEKPEWRTTWHKSGEFFQYKHQGKDPRQDQEYATLIRKHYAACVSFADAQVGLILRRLDELGLSDNTIVVLWGDHGWHLGEWSVWGKHTLFDESLHSPLIVRLPGSKQAGEVDKRLVGTVDVFPTIAGAAGLPLPVGLDGRNLLNPTESQRTEVDGVYSYFKNAKTVRTENHRLIKHKDGHLELYDFRDSALSNQAEAQKNVAERLAKAIDLEFAKSN